MTLSDAYHCKERGFGSEKRFGCLLLTSYMDEY